MIKQSQSHAGRIAALSAPGSELITLPCGVTLAVKRWGSGTPVMCLHAVGHGSGDFADLATHLGEGFELIAIDWPGMGRSPADGRPVRARHFATLAVEVADTLRLDRPLVIGNSIGGAAAIIAAASAPGRFAGLVLCNPGGLGVVDAAARFVIGRMAAFFRAGARGEWWFPLAFAAYYRRMVLTRAPAKARRDLVIAAGPALAPMLVEAWEGFGEADSDLRPLAPKLALPVWLAWAKLDQFVSWGRAKAAVAAMPHHRVTLFRGGHCAFLEDPYAFAAGFRAFAADIQQGRFA